MCKVACEYVLRSAIGDPTNVLLTQEPLTIIPIVVPTLKDGADELIGLMSTDCSAKEVVMSAEEVVETLDRTLQTGEDEDDSDSLRLGPARQLVRLLGAYSACRSFIVTYRSCH